VDSQKKSSITEAISAVGSLIPYVGQVMALAPAVKTLIGFVGETVKNYHHQGEMTEAERDSFLNDIENLKQDEAMLTDAERGKG
jgi:hypothetical protein